MPMHGSVTDSAPVGENMFSDGSLKGDKVRTCGGKVPQADEDSVQHVRSQSRSECRGSAIRRSTRLTSQIMGEQHGDHLTVIVNPSHAVTV